MDTDRVFIVGGKSFIWIMKCIGPEADEKLFSGSWFVMNTCCMQIDRPNHGEGNIYTGSSFFTIPYGKRLRN
jgi:hypothetical protein